MNKLLRIILLIGTVGVLSLAGALYFGFISLFKAEVQYATLQDAKIAYYTRGEGEPLLLLEGFGMSMEDWDPILIRELAKRNKVIVYDYRGVGLSQGDITHLSVDQMTDDTISLLDVLHIEKTNVLGWSLGSVIAQEVVRRYPQRVDHLILASTFSADTNMMGGSEEAGEYVQNNLADSWETFIPLMFPTTSFGEEEMQKYLKRRKEALNKGITPLTPPENVQIKIRQEEAMAAISQGDRLRGLSQVKAPTLLISGKDDILIPIQNARIVANSIPKAKLVEIPNAGHAVLFQNSREVIKQMNSFLN